ncbi:MAG: hypothetical protein CMK59_10245 [Proteobacteria bacterium]|nr:hypothetical protein [Pseudomonadota bacterium]
MAGCPLTYNDEVETMNEQVKYGFCVPIFANPGMLFFRTPAYEQLEWDSIKNTVILCEELGYDSLFVADHLFLGSNGDIYESIATMSALGAITKKMSVIPIHLCNNFRNPGVVAKTISTISHITSGRFELFYDYGWRKSEFDQYGIGFCKNDDERVAKMAEGLTVIKGLLEHGTFSYDGTFYKLTDAICNPKPIKKIPIWMGETNNVQMVEEIVKHADVFNSMPCSLEAFDQKCDALRIECDKQGRDFSSIELSLETQVLIRETEEEIEEELSRFGGLIDKNNSYDKDILEQLALTNPDGVDYSSKESLRKEFLIGTPEQVSAQIAGFTDRGVNHFMLWFMDYPSTKGIELFADTVMKGR